MRDLTQRSLPAEVRERLAASPTDLIDAGLAARFRTDTVEARVGRLELRANDDGTVHLTGYATTWDTTYEVAGGPPWGWIESFAKGSCTKTLAERDDVRFLLNHEGLPLARTKSATMTLTADDIGLLVDVPSLDMRNPAAQELNSALARFDVDQMSLSFIPVKQEWNEDYTHRRVLEAKLFDVSAVTYPANEATIIALRSAYEAAHQQQRGGMSLAYALALASNID